MGCDIHAFCEAKTSAGWKDLDLDWCESRSYGLFSILAGVRNYGGGEIVPIAEPRGVPADCNDRYREEWERQGRCDAHSASYFTLAEILAFDWTKEARRRAFVPLDAFLSWTGYGWYAEMRYSGSADHTCRSVGGPGVSVLPMASTYALSHRIRHENERSSPAELLSKIKTALGADTTDAEFYYVDCEWGEPYYSVAGHFWSESIPRLLALAAKHGGADNLRLLFFFDN